MKFITYISLVYASFILFLLKIEPAEQKQGDEHVSVVELEQQLHVVVDATADEIKQRERYVLKQEQELNQLYSVESMKEIWIMRYEILTVNIKL